MHTPRFSHWRLAVLLAMLAAGGLCAWWMMARTDRALRADLLQQARLVAQALSGARIQALSGTPADLAAPEYQQLKEQLTAVHSANPLCHWNYLLGRTASGMVFTFVDSEPVSSKDYSPPGQLYAEAMADCQRVFDTKTASVAGPLSNRWGTWITAMVPIVNPHTGALVAVLGMDIDAHAWQLHVAGQAALPVGLLLLLLICMAVVLLVTTNPACLDGRVDATPKPILWRLLPPLAVMVILLLAGAATLLWHQHRQQLAAVVTADIADMFGDLHVVLNQQAAVLTALAQPIAADATVQKALRAGDAARLLAAWQPALETLRRQNRITHFYLFDTNRVCLLRVHSPKRHGDLINRFTAREAERTGKTASGIELGSQGTFTLRVVQPVFEGATLVGYVELGKEIEDALQTLHPRSDIQLAVVIRKELLNRQQWEAGMRLLGREPDWDRLPNSVVMYASQGRLPDAFAAWADQTAGIDTEREIACTGQDCACTKNTWRVSAAPLQDAAGTDVGDLLVLRDVTAAKAAFARMLAVGGTAGVVLLALLLGFMYVLLRRTDAGIRAQQAARRESEERFAQLAEQSGIIVWEVDALGLCTYVSKVAEAVLGYRPDELTGRLHYYDLHPEADRAAYKNATLAMIARKEPFRDFVNIAEAKDGHRVWLSTSGLPLFNADGSLRGFRGSNTDITAHKHAEEALRESEDQYREIFDASSDALFLQDITTGAILDANKTALKMYGLADKQEALTCCIADLSAVDEGYGEVKIKKAHQSVISGHAHAFEWRAKRKNGEKFWVQVTLHATRIGGVEKILSTVRNQARLTLLGILEDQTRAEADLKRLATAIEQAAEVIVVTDAQGLIQYANPAFEAVTGYTCAEAIGQNPRLLKSGQHDAAFYRTLWDTIRSGKTWQGRFVNRKKNGALYTEEASISPVRDAAGAIANYVAVKRDISADLNLQAQLSQAQKMESVGRLAGGVAHDFNNILQTIMGGAELVIEQTEPADPRCTELVEIQNAARRAANLTRQLLAFASKQTITPRILDLNEAVEGMLKMLRRLIAENIKLVWAPSAELWPIRIDPGQVDQIMANLCVNARDAIEGVGAVHITTENNHIDELQAAQHDGVRPGDYVVLTVSDTGCGMDKATLSNIFEPFYTTKATGKGTGLGLATVYGIVRQNQGHISVYSEPGHGTTFRIHLPRHSGADAAIAESPAPPAARGSETVLLVEDDITILNMSSRMLQELGYTVLAAGAPDVALRMAGEYPGTIHLLVTDIIMPGMNGRELAERLQARIAQLKCLFMAGYTASVISHQGVL
ncbi:MAG: PAS domain S-box protein, partial [bacterium]|nr:PAS domain S-box protein [bacterium]